MAAWKMDNWNYVERQVVTDPQGRQWSVGLMDILGQEGDPEMPGHLLEAQYQAGRYFTLGLLRRGRDSARTSRISRFRRRCGSTSGC